MNNAKIEPQQVLKEFQETEIHEYYAKFDKRMNKCIGKIETLIEEYNDLSMEEMTTESYACFMRFAYIAASMGEYWGVNSLLLINGREDKDEHTYKRLKSLFHKHEEALNEWIAKNIRVDTTRYSVMANSLFDVAIKCCQECEDVVKRSNDIMHDNLNVVERKMANMHALQKLIDLGITPEHFDKIGIASDRLWEMEIDREISNTSVLHDKEVVDGVKDIHTRIFKNAPVYPHMLKSVLGYVTMCMSNEGWHRLKSLNDEELKQRYLDHEKIYCLSEDYKEKRDNLFIEELLDEGQPTTQKVSTFKHDFIGRYRSNELVKVYKKKGDDVVAIAQKAIELKCTDEQLEELFFYTAIIAELKTYEEKALPDVQNGEVHIHINEYVANKGDNYGTQIVNKDNAKAIQVLPEDAKKLLEQNKK